MRAGATTTQLPRAPADNFGHEPNLPADSHGRSDPIKNLSNKIDILLCKAMSGNVRQVPSMVRKAPLFRGFVACLDGWLR